MTPSFFMATSFVIPVQQMSQWGLPHTRHPFRGRSRGQVCILSSPVGICPFTAQLDYVILILYLYYTGIEYGEECKIQSGARISARGGRAGFGGFSVYPDSD